MTALASIVPLPTAHTVTVRVAGYLHPMLLRDATDGTDLDQVLLVREVERRPRRDGSEFLRLTLGDRSGRVPAMVWDGVREASELACTGAPVRVIGRYVVHPRYGPQVNIRALRPADPESFELEDLLDRPAREVDLMESDLRQLIATVQRPPLRVLLDRILGPEAASWPLFRDAPAAKYYHQAYRHGLLEHSLSVGQAVSAISATFPGIDRDVAVTGALLHDIGKLDAYTREDSAIELTDDGRLQGEIALGYYRVRREIESIDGFPAALAQALAHIVLSHHGTLEHGSPVLPATREATLVHMADNLGGRLGSFDRLEKELRDGERWSGFDRALGGGAFFAGREEPEPAQLDAA
jgi:3'-5' exoribonuclease